MKSADGWRTGGLVLGLLLIPGCGSSASAPSKASPSPLVRVEAILPGETPVGAEVLLLRVPTQTSGGPGISGSRSDTLAVLRRSSSGRWSGSGQVESPDPVAVRLALRENGGPAIGELDALFGPTLSRQLDPSAPQPVLFTIDHWEWPADETTVPIFFRVTVPPSSPAGASVWISGNQPVLGSWNGAGVELVERPDGEWVTRIRFPRDATIEYKFTRGGWETVEKGPGGEEISNRQHTASWADTIIAAVAAWRDQGGGGEPTHTLTGIIRYHRGVTSRHLPAVRDVVVYLPPDYGDSPERRYPVLYMHDGQNVFDAATSFAGEWGADETAQRLIEAGELDPLIIVGVYNAGAARMDEYTPVRDPGRGAGGMADAYGAFLVEELKPFIDRTYRSLPDREHTGLAGSSLGGLVTMYLGTTHADVFSRLGVVSPSVWWGNRSILQTVSQAPYSGARIWVDTGTAEWSNPTQTQAGLEDTRALRDALIARGWTLGEDLGYLEDEGAGHNEAAWRGRFERILRFLYPLD